VTRVYSTTAVEPIHRSTPVEASLPRSYNTYAAAVAATEAKQLG